MAGSGTGLKTPDLVKQVASANSQFGLDLYKKVALDLKDSNVFLSPFSISAALAMTHLGARGDTAAQMNQVLKWTDLQDSVHLGFEDYLRLLKTQGDYVLTTANRLFISDRFQLLPDFLKDTMAYYEAETALADFHGSSAGEAEKINTWVETMTNGKIQKLIEDLDPSTVLVLINAVYFKGSWEQKFSEDSTNRSTFTVTAQQEVTVNMMHMQKTLNYCFDETLNCQILEMPYIGGDLAMYLFLPCLDGLNDLERTLNINTLALALSQLQKVMVSVTLPQFKLQSSFQLNEMLKSLGITDAFDERKANLSGIDGTRLLYISQVVHKAFLEVNEEGSEAAAATAVLVKKRKRIFRGNVEYFVADRPFLMIIKDNRADMILFMGRLFNPCA